MAQVFISYARQDRDSAQRLADAIKSHGWTVWWDRRIPAGKSYEDVIEHAIDEARCVVVLWTRTSVASEWVRNEAAEGLSRKNLIPIRLEDVRIPLAFRHLQADDLFAWSSGELENCFESIESMIGQPGTPEPTPARREPPPPPPRSGPAASPVKSRRMIVMTAVLAVLIGILIISVISNRHETPAGDTATTDMGGATVAAASTDTTSTTTDAMAVFTNGTVGDTPVEVFATGTDGTSPTTTRGISVTTSVVDFQTSAGTISIEFFPNDAPNHVRSIIALVASGRFDGTAIDFRDDDGFRIGLAGPHIPFESNDIAYVRGTVMNVGHLGQGDDSSSGFFINVRPVNYDTKTCSVFGRVVGGMDVVDAIAHMAVDKNNIILKPVKIERAVLRQRGDR